jgi:hypothetical protein
VTDRKYSMTDCDSIPVKLQGQLHKDTLQWRGVTDPCLSCTGSGRILYPSTSTWRGGMGGSKSTYDVCDTCWGSGDRFVHWTDLRTLRSEEEHRINTRALEHLSDAAGATLSSAGRAVVLMADALERLARKRGAPAADHLPELARALANTLRKALRSRS